MSKSRAPRCRGLFGLIFGHKFIKVIWMETIYRSDNCWRCGFSKVGQ